MSTVLVLRTCNADGTSHKGFQWPLEVGKQVTAPDWDPVPKCGHGLHGLLWGEGDGSLLNWKSDARWLVLSVDSESIVDLKDKVKFPSCTVVHIGDQLSATQYILQHGGEGKAITGASVIVGNNSHAIAGYRGYATAGYEGHATAGYEGHATAVE